MEEQCEYCSSIFKVFGDESAKEKECFKDRGNFKIVRIGKPRDQKVISVHCANFAYVRSIKIS
jgi:hypothetical protein